MNAAKHPTPASELEAWYLHPEALAIIARMKANPPERVVNQRWYGATREEWQVFEGDDVDALRAVQKAMFEAIDATGDEPAILAFIRSGSVQDVIAAALGCPLPGTHFSDDRERLSAIADALSAPVSSPVVERKHTLGACSAPGSARFAHRTASRFAPLGDDPSRIGELA